MGRSKFTATVKVLGDRGTQYNKFTLYEVKTTMEISPGHQTESTVERRYSDFDWLRTTLVAQHRGYLIPPIPDKDPLQKIREEGKGEFLEERRQAFQQFLSRLACHEVLQNNLALTEFLTASTEGLEEKKKEVVAAPAQTGSSFSFDWFWGNITPVERPKDSDDKQCDIIEDYAKELASRLEKLHQTAQALVDRTKAMGECWNEFSIQCAYLGNFERENQEEELGAACTALAQTANILTTNTSDKSVEENKSFRSPIKDYMKYAQAVQEMCQGRTAMLKQYHNSLGRLESRQRELKNLQGVPGKEAQARDAEQAVAAAQQVVDTEQSELQNITRTTISEAERFKREKAQDIRNLIINFVKVQIDYSRKDQEAWEKILREQLPDEEVSKSSD